MREIKFRAWSVEAAAMLTMPLDTNWGLARFFGFIGDTAILMQYTGLKDKNGKDIYEGDVVKINPDDDDWNDTVVYHRGGFELKSFADALDRGFDPWVTMVRLWELSEGILKSPEAGGFEVIGNIHENPELLDV